MEFIGKDDFRLEELHQFVKEAFKDGMVPESIEEFETMLSNNTTDGSLCYANCFGEGKRDCAMIFFYPYFCVVPRAYCVNLRSGDFCNVGNLELEYQKMLAKNATEMGFLNELDLAIKQRHLSRMTALRRDLERHEKYKIHAVDKIDEYVFKHGPNSLNESISAYSNKYQEVRHFVEDKIQEGAIKEAEECPLMQIDSRTK